MERRVNILLSTLLFICAGFSALAQNDGLESNEPAPYDNDSIWMNPKGLGDIRVMTVLIEVGEERFTQDELSNIPDLIYASEPNEGAITIFTFD